MKFEPVEAKICRQWCIEGLFETMAKQLSEMTVASVEKQLPTIERMANAMFNYIESGSMHPVETPVVKLKAV